MYQAQWQILEPKPHTVSFEMGLFGHAKIMVDGVVIWQRGMIWLTYVFEHSFLVENLPCKVRLLSDWAGIPECWYNGRML
jgi:hypothetical protein